MNTPSEAPTLGPVLDRLDRIERILSDLAPLVTRKETQAEHAKRIGISRRALVYRLAKARVKLAVKEIRT
jgi:predicted DNA-binding protein (UPF0251 family)